MLMSHMVMPLIGSHVNYCQYGTFLLFVPLDPSNPFVAVWQTDLVLTVVLLVIGFGMVALGRARGRPGRGARLLGYVTLVDAAALAVLMVVTLARSQPLGCSAPGLGPGSPAGQSAYNLFEALFIVSTIMGYLGVLLVVAAIVTAIVTIVQRPAKS